MGLVELFKDTDNCQSELTDTDQLFFHSCGPLNKMYAIIE